LFWEYGVAPTARRVAPGRHRPLPPGSSAAARRSTPGVRFESLPLVYRPTDGPTSRPVVIAAGGHRERASTERRKVAPAPPTMIRRQLRSRRAAAAAAAAMTAELQTSS